MVKLHSNKHAEYIKNLINSEEKRMTRCIEKHVKKSEKYHDMLSKLYSSPNRKIYDPINYFGDSKTFSYVVNDKFVRCVRDREGEYCTWYSPLTKSAFKQYERKKKINLIKTQKEDKKKIEQKNLTEAAK